MFQSSYADDTLKEKFSQDIIESAVKLGYPDLLYKPGNNQLIIGDYGVLANELFQNDKISESHYASLMNDIGIDIYKK